MKRKARVLGILLGAALMAVCGCATTPRVPPEESKAPPEAPKAPPEAPNQHRAVWVLQTDFQGGEAALDRALADFQRAKINVLCVMVQKRGYVIYPDSECLPQFPPFNGQDVYPKLIGKAHALGMKVEAWMEYGFYAYYTQNAEDDPSQGYWLDLHPDLVSIDADGKNVIHNPQLGDFYALDAANPEAQDLVLNLLDETVRRYPFDGINLDRVRFATARHGYSDFCRNKFRADTGLDLDAVKEGNEAWARWRHWRKEQLTQFMERASRKLRETRPGLRITMATVPPESIDELGQDWPTWLQRGYLDAAYPMLYGKSPQPRFETVRRLTGNNPNVYAGLDLTVGLEPFQQAARDWMATGGRGVTIWESAALHKNAEALGADLFLEPTESPLYAPPGN